MTDCGFSWLSLRWQQVVMISQHVSQKRNGRMYSTCTVYRHNKKTSTRWLLQSSSRPHTSECKTSCSSATRQSKCCTCVSQSCAPRLGPHLLGHAKTSAKENHSIGPSVAMLSLSNVRHFRKQFVLVIHVRDNFLTTRAPPRCVKKHQDGMYCHHFGLTSPTNTTS